MPAGESWPGQLKGEGWSRATAAQALGADEDLGPQWPGVLTAQGTVLGQRPGICREETDIQAPL